MPHASLSRWTPAYFAISLLGLLLAEAAMAAGIGYPHAGLREPATLFVVHLVLIGWLSLAMAGALLQFVPVLIARPLAGTGLVLPALGALCGGVVLLCGGFAVLAGWVGAPLDMLAGAAVLLVAGFGMLVFILVRTLAAARPVELVGRFALAGLACLIAVALSGGLFALRLSGRGGDWLAALGEAVPFHAMLGIGGWLGLITFGVSYRLFAMFVVAPDVAVTQGVRVLGLGVVALVIALLGLIGLLPVATTSVAAAVLYAAAVAFYGADVRALLRQRRRKALEINMAASLPALFALVAGTTLLSAALWLGAGEALIAAAAFVLVFGWLSGMTLAQLCRIVPFMTWIEVYAPRLGRGSVPRVGDLLAARRTAVWFVVYYLGVGAGALALAVSAAGIFRAAMCAALAGTTGIVAELVRARRLDGVGAGQRSEAWRPSLFAASIPDRS